MKSSDADTSRGRKTGVSMESTPPPKRTRTERETEKGAEIRPETAGVKEMSVTAAMAVAAVVAGRSVLSAVTGVSAHREMDGLSASVGEAREMNP